MQVFSFCHQKCLQASFPMDIKDSESEEKSEDESSSEESSSGSESEEERKKPTKERRVINLIKINKKISLN